MGEREYSKGCEQWHSVHVSSKDVFKSLVFWGTGSMMIEIRIRINPAVFISRWCQANPGNMTNLKGKAKLVQVANKLMWWQFLIASCSRSQNPNIVPVPQDHLMERVSTANRMVDENLVLLQISESILVHVPCNLQICWRLELLQHRLVKSKSVKLSDLEQGVDVYWAHFGLLPQQSFESSSNLIRTVVLNGNSKLRFSVKPPASSSSQSCFALLSRWWHPPGKSSDYQFLKSTAWEILWLWSYPASQRIRRGLLQRLPVKPRRLLHVFQLNQVAEPHPTDSKPNEVNFLHLKTCSLCTT